MELIFTKQADRWVAEFIANNDFNLHIEGVVEGNVSVFQRGSESGNYAFVKEGTPHPSYANVYDYDFAALIYPKFIKVSCATEPTSGIVTSDGEITEIKAQTKEIEVTSNGTTEVTPDAGFSYLNSVKVKTNVQSGGGSTMEYFSAQDAPQLKPYMSAVKMVAHAGAVTQVSNYTPKLANIVESAEILAFGVDFQARNVVVAGGQKIEMPSLDAIIQETGLSADQLAAIPRLTEEEFYNLNGGE